MSPLGVVTRILHNKTAVRVRTQAGPRSARVRVSIAKPLLRLFCAMELGIQSVKCHPGCTRTLVWLRREKSLIGHLFCRRIRDLLYQPVQI